jgi:acyl-coenzyme A synthetase/AMP-(fatty) acid ligase
MLTVGRTTALFTPDTYRGFGHRELGERLRAEVPTLKAHITVPGPEQNPEWLPTTFSGPAYSASEISRPASAVSELLFTSGTEAAPKAVMHTEQTTNFAARNVQESLGLGEGDVVWMPSPIGHSTGLNYGVRMALYHGLPLVLQDRWSASDALGLIGRFGCSYTLVATTFVSDLVDAAARAGTDLSCLHMLGSGGAPIPPELVDAAANCGATVLRLYGSTEVLVAAWNRPESPATTRRDTDGPPLAHMEVEVRSHEGQAVIDTEGEIFVRGPSTSVGFYADESRTAATYDADGWIRSGDLGIVDRAGNLTVVGRLKEIIIRGGLNVAPREIEELLLRHPAVSEVAVIGVADERLGEITCACVVPTAGVTTTLDALVDFLRDAELAAFKLPQRLMLVENLPKTPTGKVQKVLLAKQAAEACA